MMSSPMDAVIAAEEVIAAGLIEAGGPLLRSAALPDEGYTGILLMRVYRRLLVGAIATNAEVFVEPRRREEAMRRSWALLLREIEETLEDRIHSVTEQAAAELAAEAQS